MLFERITHDPRVMGGRPCIRGMRVTVGMIVRQLGAGLSIDTALADYPFLEREGILQALRYAAWRVEEREVVLVVANAGPLDPDGSTRLCHGPIQ